MISPTLFELAAITGLQPIGKVIHLDLVLDFVKAYNVADSETSYSAFIRNNIGPSSSPVSDDEHVAFLSYWLNAVVFYGRSFQIQ